MSRMFRFIKLFLVVVLVSGPFLYLTDWLFIKIFHFNYLSYSDWGKISIFWQKGGIIRVVKDYVFLFSLFVLLPASFALVLRLFCKIKYLKLFLIPLNAYNDYIINKYGSRSNRVVLKNLGRSKKIEEELNDLAKPKIEDSKKLSQNIRLALQEKLMNTKK